MALPVPARTAISGAGALLLGGILGLALWLWRRRSGRNRNSRLARVGLALAIGGLVLIAVGTVSRVVVAFQSPSPCSAPPRVRAQTSSPHLSSQHLSAALVAEEITTAPETGLAMLYVRAINAPLCRSVSADYYVAIHATDVNGGRAVNVGDIVVSPRYNLSNQEMINLAAHEARHRSQWAVATVTGGPFAYPVAYAIDEFFFPGDRNHFERQAGLESGGYSHVGYGPVLGLPQIAVLCAIPVVIAVAWLVARRRRTARAWRRIRSPAQR